MRTVPRVSIEVFPPRGEAAEVQLQETLAKLTPLAPDYVSVTYGAGGSAARDLSTRTLAMVLQHEGLNPAGHLTCVGAPCSHVDGMARDWWELGVRRIVALRGDMPDMGSAYRPHPEGYGTTADLVCGLKAVGDFDISVGAYPEGHPESPDLDADLDNLKSKLDAGAARAITQYFFEPETFLRFRDRARARGITAPLVPGIMPIFHFGKIVAFSQRCGASIPSWLAERFEGLDDDPETRGQVSASLSVRLCERLIAEGVDAFHFYTLNRPTLTLAVCRAIGIQPAGLKEAA